MEPGKSECSVLFITSLDQLIAREADIVRRINERANGGRLLLIDPQRLFRDLGIDIAGDVFHEWKASHAEFFRQTGSEDAYEIVSRSRPRDDVEIIVEGLFQKRQS
jgi:hypothetical protein